MYTRRAFLNTVRPLEPRLAARRAGEHSSGPRTQQFPASAEIGWIPRKTTASSAGIPHLGLFPLPENTVRATNYAMLLAVYTFSPPERRSVAECY
jgi:hypothetical protein